jgi:acyl-CoA reductase-like NAD-dependent aldehyde dehydrogenase
VSQPVVLADVSPTSRIYTDETFGPAVILIRATDTQHAIQLANSHETGLTASVWSKDYKEALDVAKRLESGAVRVPCGSRERGADGSRYTSML